MPLLQINVPITNGTGDASLKTHLKNIRNVFLESISMHLTVASGAGNSHFLVSTNIPCMSRNIANDQDRVIVNDDGVSTFLKDEYRNCRYVNADFLHVCRVSIQNSDNTPATTVSRCILTFSYF